MDIKNLVVLALRTCALILTYFIVMSGLELFHAIANGGNKILIPLLNTSLLSTAAIMAWFFPFFLADMLLKDVKPQTSGTINPKQLLHISIIILGLGFFLFALIDLAYWLFYYNFLNSEPTNHNTNRLTVGLFNIGFRLFISVVLLSKSYWLTVFLIRLNSPEVNLPKTNTAEKAEAKKDHAN